MEAVAAKTNKTIFQLNPTPTHFQLHVVMNYFPRR